MMTSLPRSVRTSSIHFDVWWNEFASVRNVMCSVLLFSFYESVKKRRKEGQRTCNIIHNHGNSRISDVGWNEWSKPFLSSCVPQLKPYRTILEIHCLGQKVNTNCGLSMKNKQTLAINNSKIFCCNQILKGNVTWYVLSKLSYINLVIREVFPTEKETHTQISYAWKDEKNGKAERSLKEPWESWRDSQCLIMVHIEKIVPILVYTWYSGERGT